ncbi:MAG: serine protease [Deltaproteobacteria bacterium]|nr:serine protease [Deltaproteobacteria bacterium]MDQ3298297.1 S1C family serine protease [Myxococcota bacterium]
MPGHRLASVVALAVAAAGACGGGGGKATEIPKADKPLTAKDIVQRSSPAIVRIEAQGAEGEQFGTGFIVDKTGVVATNFHVIAGTSDIKVKLHDGSHYPVSAILNVDPLRDLVLVKFDAPRALPTLRLGDSSKVTTGDQIVAIGNPLGVFENTVSEGLISSIREICSKQAVAENSATCPSELTLLQISAPISQGSSGGPLFNQLGEVVGVTTAIIAQGQLINFAMPVNYLKPLFAKQQPIGVEDFAKATRRDTGGVSKIDRAPYSREGFPVAVYEGCRPEQIGEIVKAIEDAIEVGAPLYNKGEIEACFRIYEGTATKLERDGACKGVRAAFGDGLLKANAMSDYKAKAWTMRDTFDGFLIAADKWAKANGAKKPKS